MTSPNSAARYDSSTDKLRVEVTGAVAVVTFNNPAKHNALSSAMIIALSKILVALQADPQVRVVVVTGAGDKAFASGADISEFGEQRTTSAARAEYDRHQAKLTIAWDSLDKPVIAMVRGSCLGNGLLTALRADIRIASEDSQFGIPAARLGLGYEFSGVIALMSVVGPAWTSEILFSARRFSALEALQMGLVNRVVPAADLRPVVADLAERIAAGAPLTVAAAKAAIREARRPPELRDLAGVAAKVEACFQSEDYLEGQRAFGEKRPPTFTGR